MTSAEYLERVRSLLPALRARAVQAEQLRRLPDETFKDFQALGLFRCLQPKRYEGFELDPGTFYQAIMEVGTVCGSSAWILGVVGVHNWHLALFPPRAQQDVWGEDTSVHFRRRWPRRVRWSVSMAAFACGAAGRFPACATTASGRCWEVCCIYLSNPIQRAWRDVHAMRAHAGSNPEKAAAVFGRSEFGLPPMDLRF